MDKPTLAECVERARALAQLKRSYYIPDADAAALARLIEIAERVQDASGGDVAFTVFRAGFKAHHQYDTPLSVDGWDAALAWARGER